MPNSAWCRNSCYENGYRIELHNVRFKPEKARRAAEKVKNREALGDYIRKWYSTISHERVEFSQYEMPTWKMRRKDKRVRAHKNKARKAAEQAQANGSCTGVQHTASHTQTHQNTHGENGGAQMLSLHSVHSYTNDATKC
jgi:hypothetical protein